MQEIGDFNSLRLDSSVLTIGSFDGVHQGHQLLIRTLVAEAKSKRLPSVVLAFYPHPSVVLRGRQPVFYITSPEEKAALLGGLGVEYVVSQHFTEELSQVTASSFLDMLQERLGLASLWIGEDFALGHRREGNRLFLERASQERGFNLHVVGPAKISGEVVSSTRVREALRSGDVARASTYLGRPFSIPGTVVRGAGRGRALGIPTANLLVWEERAFPAAGVYACLADFAGGRWKAVTNVGFRPTFDERNRLPTIETHVLDFEGELYEQEVRLSFVERLRDERRFPGPEALVAQIREDILKARQVLDHRPEDADV